MEAFHHFHITEAQVNGGSFGQEIETLPSWTVEWTAPTVMSTTVITLTLGVTDSNMASDESSITITVSPETAPPSNSAPSVTVNVSSTTVVEGTSITVSASVSDDRDTLSQLDYSWSSNQGGSFTDSSRRNTTWTAPDVSNDINVTLTLAVLDTDGSTGRDSITVRVTHIISTTNTPPSIDSITTSVMSVQGGGTVALVAVVSDAQDPVADLTLNWTSSNGGFFNPPGVLETTWTAPGVPVEQDIELTLTVTDTGNLTNSRNVSIRVLESLIIVLEGTISSGEPVGYGEIPGLSLTLDLLGGTINSGEATIDATLLITEPLIIGQISGFFRDGHVVTADMLNELGFKVGIGHPELVLGPAYRLGRWYLDFGTMTLWFDAGTAWVPRLQTNPSATIGGLRTLGRTALEAAPGVHDHEVQYSSHGVAFETEDGDDPQSFIRPSGARLSLLITSGVFLDTPDNSVDVGAQIGTSVNNVTYTWRTGPAEHVLTVDSGDRYFQGGDAYYIIAVGPSYIWTSPPSTGYVRIRKTYSNSAVNRAYVRAEWITAI